MSKPCSPRDRRSRAHRLPAFAITLAATMFVMSGQVHRCHPSAASTVTTASPTRPRCGSGRRCRRAATARRTLTAAACAPRGSASTVRRWSPCNREGRPRLVRRRASNDVSRSRSSRDRPSPETNDKEHHALARPQRTARRQGTCGALHPPCPRRCRRRAARRRPSDPHPAAHGRGARETRHAVRPEGRGLRCDARERGAAARRSEGRRGARALLRQGRWDRRVGRTPEASR